MPLKLTILLILLSAALASAEDHYSYENGVSEHTTKENEHDEDVTYLESQPTVYSEETEFALFYTIYLNAKLSIQDIKTSVKIVANLRDLVALVSTTGEVVAGVGFSSDLLSKICPGKFRNFSFVSREGKLGDLPATGGDIFVHAKSSSYGKLFELAQQLSGRLRWAVAKASDTYGFNYRITRDLTGFIDGTGNPKGPEERRKVAVVPSTGGSYALAQRWVHNMTRISSLKKCTMEPYIGRTMGDSTELLKKAPSSHVARMVGGTGFEETPRFEIVRQSMPYGALHGEAGLFFIAYAAAVANFDFMLDRMVGITDGIPDDVMRLTRCVTGNYWYFPGADELKNFAN